MTTTTMMILTTAMNQRRQVDASLFAYRTCYKIKRNNSEVEHKQIYYQSFQTKYYFEAEAPFNF